MTPLSESDEWETPSEEYTSLIYQYNFDPILDVCATDQNAMLDNFLTKDDNSLSKKWAKSNWCNPPNSKPNKKLFIQKAHEEFLKYGNETLMIIPANTLCTVYAREFILNPKYHYEPITRRIRFLFDGEEIDNAKMGYFSVFFGNYAELSKRG